jgi:hypothetical protein
MRANQARTVWTIVLGLVALMLLASSPVLGEEESGTTTLEGGESLAIAVNNSVGENLWVEYTVRVIEGPSVNVWVLDEAGHRAYFDDNLSRFSYYNDESVEESTYAEESFYWDDAGTFYVVIDNEFNVAVNQTARVEYTVTWEVSEFDATLLYLLIGLIVVIIVVVTVLVAFMTVKRAQVMTEAKKAEEERVVESRFDETGAEEDQVVDGGPPRPPAPYPKEVVEASMRRLDDDDATGWDPSRDEPVD